MGATSKIEWTDATWNPIRGCSMAPGSENAGCLNCYAARYMARNLPGLNSPTTGEAFAVMRKAGPRWTGRVEVIAKALTLPLHWKEPRRIFVNSLSDLYHESLSFSDILRIHVVMQMADWHTYQVLTKRPQRAKEFYHWWDRTWPGHGYPRRLQLGVSVENRANRDRINVLQQIPVTERFLSLEPLLEDLGTLNLRGINRVICGAESGPGARDCDLAAVSSIVRQCEAAGVRCLVKQIGRRPYLTLWSLSSKALRIPIRIRDRKGANPEEWPTYLQVRQ